jgi:hypothetical protein
MARWFLASSSCFKSDGGEEHWDDCRSLADAIDTRAVYLNSSYCQSPRMIACRISAGFLPVLWSRYARRTSLRHTIQPAEWLSR